MGSKNRLSKELVPIIQKYIDDSGYDKYLEPFVGGANMIDKIKCKHKFGSDNHKYLIALLKQASKDISIFPLHISEEEYKNVRDNKDNYSDWYVGLVGFCATFSGKWFNGYARGFKEDKITPRDIPNETIRNIIKQAPNLKGIKFSCCDFRAIKKI
jgi:site-specific DNA-adenine methylase